MSRSALWRQEANVNERHRQAIDIFESALEEGKNNQSRKGTIPIVGGDKFNLNPMLFQNIRQNPYFLKCCTKFHDWSSTVDEIYYEVKHMEPWTPGTFVLPTTPTL